MGKLKSGQMSKRQKEIYDIIKEYHAEYGIAPAISEIANSLDLSVAATAIYINILKKKGFAKSMPGIPRSLVVIEKPEGEQIIA
jgi:SOS-response transcriptional repressor LexA